MTKAKAENPIDPRRIEYLPLGSITPDERNPKAHDTDTIDASIGRFGMLDLIVKDERTGHIVSGHGRHKVLTGMAERGENPPEGVKVDGEGNWLVPVVTGWASRTDSEAAAALIALNRTTELGGWVDEALLDLLGDLEVQDGGLVGIGYGEDDISALRSYLDASVDDPEHLSDEEFDDLINPEDGGLLTLTIAGLTNSDIGAFRAITGKDDAERLRSLLPQDAYADVSDENDDEE